MARQKVVKEVPLKKVPINIDLSGTKPEDVLHGVNIDLTINGVPVKSVFRITWTVSDTELATWTIEGYGPPPEGFVNTLKNSSPSRS